ncbi:GIY-YIG nuclease family protein [Mucilaginibacter xinganensis]|uniref:GIY-YIG nuclease family protein n=1 Tax=Mucilaginibacter xinganensis TaxID=1234841 RepID=UPI000B986F83|nr:GIY-YIG nuclease family protein [Mucilaginibacter xinganensis]
MKRVEQIKCIYSISCPISNEVVYVGATKDAKIRFYNHLKAYSDSSLAKWVKCLRINGLVPIIIPIEEITHTDDLKRSERKWIKYYRSKNFILFNGYFRNGEQFIK